MLHRAEDQSIKGSQRYTGLYELVASVAVPLSLVSFFASSDFFCAAICHAGMAALPLGLLYEGFSVDGVEVDVEAVAVLVP